MRPRTSLMLPLLSAAMLLPAHPAFAGVVSPANSTVPACLALCPLGDLSVTIVTRDLANNPIAGVFVTLDFGACPGAYLCAPIPADPYTLDLATRRLTMNTNANGSVTIPARVGGTAPAGCVRVFANGILLAQRVLASPDQDGNGRVVSIVGTDDPTFAAKLGSHDPTADFDCSGTVDAVDQLIFDRHHSHSCLGFVDGTTRRSWGAVKLHYR